MYVRRWCEDIQDAWKTSGRRYWKMERGDELMPLPFPWMESLLTLMDVSEQSNCIYEAELRMRRLKGPTPEFDVDGLKIFVAGHIPRLPHVKLY
jgi:hypothetical protein